MRRRALLPLLAGAALAGMLPALSAPAGAQVEAPAPPAPPSPTIPLERCEDLKGARCGSLTVPVDRTDPSLGTIDIGFELHGQRDAALPYLGTIVAVEGGPGYSTRASRDYYLDLFEPLLEQRRLLMVDNRGTGSSGAIDCPALQSYQGDYVANAGACGEQLGPTSDLYGTHQAVDDLADVLDALALEQVDLYGDSYGTFFSQAFAVRHPDRLRSLVLDSAYWVEGTDPWYIDTNRAMRDAFRYACARDLGCAAVGGDPMARIATLAERLRAAPIVGTAKDADGVLLPVTFDVDTLIDLTTAAATSPTVYRELDGAIRAALPDTTGSNEPADTGPLLRLAAETVYRGDAGPVEEFSEGLYIAVACNDYPQPYDMTSPIADRPAQYAAAIEGLESDDPGAFAPFTVDEWVTSPYGYYDSCLRWPVPSRVDPPVPPDAVYPDVPTLVLAGDLDSLTSPEGAILTAGAFPDATYVEVANMTHVTALADYGRCGSAIVVHFVSTLDVGDTSCAPAFAEIRVVDRFARRAVDLDLPPDLRTATIAAHTVADVQARWLNMTGYEGVGLRGGRFTTNDGPLVRWRLDRVRWVEDVALDGTLRWDRTTGEIQARVTVSGPGALPADLVLSWSDWDAHATATVVGTIDNRPVELSLPAP